MTDAPPTSPPALLLLTICDPMQVPSICGSACSIFACRGACLIIADPVKLVQVPIMAPPVQAFAGASVTGAPLNAQPLLMPGTVAVIAPPSFGNSTLPGELPPLPLLSSIVRPLLGIAACPVPSVYTQPSNMLQTAGAKSRGYDAASIQNATLHKIVVLLQFSNSRAIPC